MPRPPYYGKLGVAEHRGDGWYSIWLSRNMEPEPCELMEPVIVEPDRERDDDLEAARIAWQAAMEKLRANQRQVIVLRFGLGHTLEDCAERMGVTRERVRQIEVKAIRALRAILASDAARADLDRERRHGRRFDRAAREIKREIELEAMQ